MVLLCGIDEAGRGPVIGPLVMVGVCIDERFNHKLRMIGAKDSKLLTPQTREKLFDQIIQLVDSYEIHISAPQDIDRAVNSDTLNLNWLEAINSALIINKLNPDKAILDCPSNNDKTYVAYVRKHLINKNIEIIAEHKADAIYPTVSAASIIAKVTRDREIEKLKKKYDIDFGSGYPSDQKTVDFLNKNWDKYNFFRKSWASYKKVESLKSQSRLGSFGR